MRKNETVLYNRASWALTHLRKAGLVASHQGATSITEQGRCILQQNPPKIDRQFLMGIPEFVVSYSKPSGKKPDEKPPPAVQNGLQGFKNMDPDDLVSRMLDEYKTLDKNLQKELTREYVRAGSIKSIMKSRPHIPEVVIRRHVRTPMRLPEGLRVRNREGGLHPDPQLSLQIALFAVNLHEWDGGNDESTEGVLQTAELIARHLVASHHSQKTKETVSARRNNTTPPADPVPTATAIWIAVATLHREHGTNRVFSTNQIVETVRGQNLCDVSDNTLLAHVSSHCVANSPANNKYVHRKTYRVGPGVYRLYRRGDPCHQTRESCSIAPLPFQLPPQYKDFRQWYDNKYCAQR